MSETERYPHIVRAFQSTAWAIRHETFATIRQIVAMRAQGHRFSHEEIQARVGDGRAEQREFQMVGSVAIMPVYGVLIPRADAYSEMSGATSVQRLQSTFLSAVDDESVSAIVLDIESPGGSADLIPEFAAAIREARGSKPIVAVANTRAASGAYYIAAQADEIVVTPSGDVGSIGVFAAHEDISKALEQEGVDVTLVEAKDSPFKTEGSPFKPLSEGALAEIQARVDEVMDMFVADVALGRGVTEAKVLADFGQGRMVTAEKAVKAGMADSVGTLEATVQRLARSKAHAPVQEPEQVQPGDLSAVSNDASRMVTVTFSGNEANLRGATSTTAPTFTDTVDEALRAFDAVVNGAGALRALTGRKRDQLTALIERGTELLTASAPDDAVEDDEGLELEHQLAGHSARRRALTY